MLTSRQSRCASALRTSAAVVAVVCGLGRHGVAREPVPSSRASGPKFEARRWSGARTGTIDEGVFGLALTATRCAVRAGTIDNPATLTVIDYSKPSSDRRMWVFDLRRQRLLFEELVAHGKGSGENFASVFSNEPDAHTSSLGLFLTEDTYVGKNGYSLRLKGLDDGFNDRAGERAIVMHGAPYVSDALVRKQGRLGRSWGCPALRESVARDVIDQVKGGGLLFVYFPDQTWLHSSKYLGTCAAASDGH